MATTYELIASTTLGSTTLNFSLASIPGTFDDLHVIVSSRTNRAAVNDAVIVRFNGDSSTTVYSNRNLYGNGASAASTADFFRTGGFLYVGETCGDTATANTFGSLEIYIPNYAGSTNKSVSSTAVSETNGTTAYINALAALWASTSAINEITFYASGGSYLAGTTVHLYGITKA